MAEEKSSSNHGATAVQATAAEEDLMLAKQSVFHQVAAGGLQEEAKKKNTLAQKEEQPPEAAKDPSATTGSLFDQVTRSFLAASTTANDQTSPDAHPTTTTLDVVKGKSLEQPSFGGRSTTAAIRKDIVLNFGVLDDNGEEESPEVAPARTSAGSSLPTVPLTAGNALRGPPLPGAFPGGGGSGSIEFDASRGSFVVGSDEDPTPPILEDGLAQARPVVLPTETAEPVQPKKHDQDSKKSLLFWGIAAMVVVIGIVIGVTLFLVGKKEGNSNNKESSSPIPGGAGVDSGDFWDWDLPFALPNATRLAFEQDIDHKTPVSKAFQWSKQDPYLDTYSEARNLQRFVLALFYFATIGDGWIHDGNDIATGTVELPDFVIDHYLNRGRDGPGRRHLELEAEEEVAWYFATSVPPSSGGLRRKLQPPGGGGKCGGFIPKIGGIKKVNITARPWLSYTDSECDWFSTAPLVNLTVCNGQGEMFALDLELNNLAGTLPPEIALFGSLNILNLWGNNIGAPLFTDIGKLTNLRFLYGRRNHLTGTVPSELGLLTDLWQLDINQNSLRGRLPKEFWTMSNLEQIHIGDNQFSGSLPDNIGSLLPKLRTLRVRQNQFTGTLPTSLGLLPDLWVLAAWTNQFSGTIPTELGNLSNLHYFLFQGNRLHGTIPSEMGQLPLVQMKLTGNPGITGTLPSELGLLNGTIYVFDIQGTSITGTIPEGLCSLECVFFDCSPTLCGCDCPCRSNSTTF